MSRYLLDTCAFLWLEERQWDRFGAEALGLIREKAEFILSDVSIWEMCIKSASGKLRSKRPIWQTVADYSAHGMQTLAIQHAHIYMIEGLPFHHRDPFDRLIVAQALTEDIPLISADKQLDLYGVNRVWA